MGLFDFYRRSDLNPIIERLDTVLRRLHIMPTEAELDAKLAELSTEISAAAQRVLDQLAALAAANPDLTDEIATINAQVEALRAIAPTPPAPVPPAEPAAAEPTP